MRNLAFNRSISITFVDIQLSARNMGPVPHRVDAHALKLLQVIKLGKSTRITTASLHELVMRQREPK